MAAARWCAIFLLAFLGLSALAGSVPMIAHPYGNPLGMPQSLLLNTPFRSYLAPGILLLVFNGLLALWCLWTVWGRRPRYGGWTAFQGVVLVLWIMVECVMLHVVVWAHYLYAAVGFALIVAGTFTNAPTHPHHRPLDD